MTDPGRLSSAVRALRNGDPLPGNLRLTGDLEQARNDFLREADVLSIANPERLWGQLQFGLIDLYDPETGDVFGQVPMSQLEGDTKIAYARYLDWMTSGAGKGDTAAAAGGPEVRGLIARVNEAREAVSAAADGFTLPTGKELKLKADLFAVDPEGILRLPILAAFRGRKAKAGLTIDHFDKLLFGGAPEEVEDDIREVMADIADVEPSAIDVNSAELSFPGALTKSGAPLRLKGTSLVNALSAVRRANTEYAAVLRELLVTSPTSAQPYMLTLRGMISNGMVTLSEPEFNSIRARAGDEFAFGLYTATGPGALQVGTGAADVSEGLRSGARGALPSGGNDPSAALRELVTGVFDQQIGGIDAMLFGNPTPEDIAQMLRNFDSARLSSALELLEAGEPPGATPSQAP